MDPNETVQRAVNAIPGDLEGFLDACADLCTWLDKGGFVPDNIMELKNKHLLLLGMHGRCWEQMTIMGARGSMPVVRKGREVSDYQQRLATLAKLDGEVP